MSFWDFIWFIFWAYIFIAYLMVMFQIIADIFRDHDLGGGAKALWFIGLLFLPIVVALIYLIVRGKPMAERHMQRAQQARDQSEQYIQTVAGRGNPAAEISSAKKLRDAGTITQAEFDRIKAKALA
jgi:hypothetical protein